MDPYALGVGIIILAGVVGGFITLGIVASVNQSGRELDQMQAEINRMVREAEGRTRQALEEERRIEQEQEKERDLDRWGRSGFN